MSEIKFPINPEFHNPKLTKRLEDSDEELPTICELHREVYRLCQSRLMNLDKELAESIMEIIARTFDMAKRMGEKLKEYHDAENKLNTDV